MKTHCNQYLRGLTMQPFSPLPLAGISYKFRKYIFLRGIKRQRAPGAWQDVKNSIEIESTGIKNELHQYKDAWTRYRPTARPQGDLTIRSETIKKQSTDSNDKAGNLKSSIEILREKWLYT